MNKYFGTDGIRGIFGKDLTMELAFECGRILGRKNLKILIGRDTRFSSEILTHVFVLGAISNGADVVDVGICPTAGISYLTKINNFHFGIVISASHNPSEYNGIKFFGADGRKISKNVENRLEKQIFKQTDKNINLKIGHYFFDKNLKKDYEKFLLSNGIDLESMKVVLDCANGASYEIAENIFKSLNAEVIMINNNPTGFNINKKCGAINLKGLKDTVLKERANIGFAFDGDSDRVIAVDEKGQIVDGDKLIYFFANYYLKNNLLDKKIVVGTQITNSTIENELLKRDIKLIRTKVGDKYIDEILEKDKLLIGGEQCGHVMLKDKLPTGDGILNAVFAATILKKENKTLSQYFDFEIGMQTTKNINVKNKNKTLKCKNLVKYIKNIQKYLKNNEKLLVRSSGTENKIRIMIESNNIKKSKKIIKNIEKIINENNEGSV